MSMNFAITTHAALAANPLIADTPIETVQNVTEAFSALLVLMAPQHSDLTRLMAPLLSALEHVASTRE